MGGAQTIVNESLRDLLELIKVEQVPGVMSYLYKGKWHTVDIAVRTLTNKNMQVEMLPGKHSSTEHIAIDQPVGIVFQHEFSKYIIESVVVGYQSSANNSSANRVIVKKPLRAEEMQRRAYTRVEVPKSLSVKVLFWHRGYNDDCTEVPLDNYWQGKLSDVSGGGMQVLVEEGLKDNFRQGQLIGVQFTPMPYQKPIIAEGVIRHVAEPKGDIVSLGVEFVGLEATSQGRDKLRRISDTINKYQQQNPSPVEPIT